MPATVERADPDGLALSFDSLEHDKFRRLKDLVDSLLLREWEDLLQEVGAGSSASPVPTPDESLAVADAKGAPKPVPRAPMSGEELDRSAPERPPRAPDDDQSESERWNAVLRRLGLEGLQLPSDGTLVRQWREFLRRRADDT